MAYRNLRGLTKKDVTQILTKFHDHHTQQPINETDEAKQVLQPFLKDLEKRLKPKGYCDRIEYTGRNYHGVKMKSSEEFDILFILNKRGLVVVEDLPNKVSQVRLKLKPGTRRDRPTINCEFLEGRYIQATELVELFEEAVEECVREIPKTAGVQVKVVCHADTTQLDFIRNSQVWFSVVLVPTMELDGKAAGTVSRFVPKKTKKDSKGWQIDYSLEEKDKFDGMHRGVEGQKYCLRILKALRLKYLNLQILPNYYFKTVLLEMKKKNLNWDQENMADRMLDLLEYAESSLRSGTIPDSEIPGTYLLQNINKDLRENTARQVHNILINKQGKFRKSFKI